MKYKPLVLAAAALVAGYLSLGGARAANVMTGGAMPGIATSQDANIQVASHHWRRHHHGFGSGAFLGFGFPGFYQPYYYEPYYYQPYYYGDSYSYAPAGGSRHVRYCLSRYRTYSVRSNTFVGLDGYRHRCRSPYRY
jgi:hypothetical protein